MSDHARDEIRLQVIWNRLLAIVEEQAQTLMRTAFSSTVREAGDLAAGFFDPQARMVAQAVTGTPGHVNTMAASVSHFLTKIPADQLRPGDQLISNDPWHTAGHLHDLTVVAPVFRGGRIIGYFATCCHQVDIGGLGQGPDGRSIFEEGLQIPVMRLVKQGQLNDELIELMCENVRTPFELRGDLLSYVTANESAGRHLNDALDDLGLADLTSEADAILTRSKIAVEDAIAKVPAGSWSHRIQLDGYDKPVTIACRLTVKDKIVEVDYAGSDPASAYGINVVMNYCAAYTSFALKCVLAPDVPNNSGSLAPFSIVAPEGSILNVRRPWPVSARHLIGQMLPDAVFGCLDQAMPGQVLAEGASCNWTVQLRRGPDQAQKGAPIFDAVFFNTGGMGARPALDGLSAVAFPSGVKAMPVEVVEHNSPIVIWRKELRADSGGAGATRGGLGVTVEVGSRVAVPFSLLAMFERTTNAAKGRTGGHDGEVGQVMLRSGRQLQSKGLQEIPAGEVVVFDTPGGAGYGDPLGRDRDLVAADVKAGVVSQDEARHRYGFQEEA